jgi:hypothetical protein
MPSPEIKPELRVAWNKMTNCEVRKSLLDLGLQVELKNSKNRHFKIKGKIRQVDLYASTGTVSANRKGDLKYCSHKEMMPLRAFDRIKTLANIGY